MCSCTLERTETHLPSDRCAVLDVNVCVWPEINLYPEKTASLATMIGSE